MATELETPNNKKREKSTNMKYEFSSVYDSCSGIYEMTFGAANKAKPRWAG